MAEDDKKSLLTSLPGILTGLAAVLAAAGALIYHNQTKPKNHKPKPEPASIQQASNAPAGGSATQAGGSAAPAGDSKASPSEPSNQPAPEGFQQQASYSGDCASPPAGSACISFRDGYQWLVQDVVKEKRKDVGAWENHQVLEASGKQGLYQHILGTDYVKTVAK